MTRVGGNPSVESSTKSRKGQLQQQRSVRATEKRRQGAAILGAGRQEGSEITGESIHSTAATLKYRVPKAAHESAWTVHGGHQNRLVDCSEIRTSYQWMEPSVRFEAASRTTCPAFKHRHLQLETAFKSEASSGRTNYF